ncbi:MAG: proprotein convertase P-domain-containing protein [Byssovorax sp.]
MRNTLPGGLAAVICALWLGAAACGGGSGSSSTSSSSTTGQGGAMTTASGTGGSGTTSSAGGAGGTGGSACDPTKCPPPSNACVEATCADDGACTEKPLADGMLAATQAPGDCRKAVCNGGMVTSQNDDGDIADDGNDCTDDTCDMGEAKHLAKPIDTACGPGGTSFCNGNGICVGCNTADQCSGPKDECQQPSCDNGVCGTSFTPMGTPTMSQTMGDCKQNQCDGNGAIVPAADPNDPEDDGNPCTDDACAGDMPTHLPSMINQGCGNDLKCDGAGNCVTCTSDNDCPVPGNACLVAQCVAGMCGTANKLDGTACNDGNACTQSDTCQNGACTGNNPIVCSAQDQCHTAGVCAPATGVCSNPSKANGTACNDGNACTQSDTCQNGTCTGANPVVCPAPDQCHTAGACNSGTGVCSYPNKPDGAACTVMGVAGTCGNGACAACGNGVVEGNEQCDDGNVTPCDGCSPKCQLDTSITYASAAGLAQAIPDDGYNGMQSSMACVNVNVVASGDSVVDYVCPTIGMAHTWIGDLVIKLISPMGTVVTLMSRPGVIEAVDDGSAIGGDSSNLLATFPIAWKDGAAVSAENMGNTIASSGVVCRDDNACVFDPNAGIASPGKLAAFIGQAGPGTWKLCVGDGGAGDTGSIDQVKLVIGQ